MIDECWHSILQALRSAPDAKVKIKICFNYQTYVEEPTVSSPKRLLEKWDSHPLMQDYTPELVIKTNEDPFYNIADWRREVYDPEAKYTVWGESDTILPRDFFAILNMVEIDQPHVLTFAGRPMWDNSWDVVTHEKLLGWDKPCECKPHKDDCIELLDAPFKYKDYINQEQLDKFNDESGDIKIKQVPHKIDGSLVCISKGHKTPFIAPDMHFVREDTCFEYVCRKRNIPQVCVTTRLKGHNYWHPQKRSGTNASRNDEVFKKYAEQSQVAMAKFLNEL
tara:strand:- start:4382 stop:5218 length:837 start_codon:yes stop_codon:yes gene_type:complete